MTANEFINTLMYNTMQILDVTNASTQVLLKNDFLQFLNILLLYSSTVHLYKHPYSTGIIIFRSP